MSPPNKKSKIDLGLGGDLYERRKTADNFIDVYFSVPGTLVKIPAHKCVLITTSSIFETMMTQRWAPGDEINVPDKISVDAVEQFVKHLYLKQLDDDLDLNLILEVMLLADHYGVTKLFEICDERLLDKVSPENCVLIYQHTRLFETVEIKNISFDCILNHFGQPSSLQPEITEWDAETLEAILERNYLKHIPELVLFQKLLEWRDYDLEGRLEKFTELLKLVRFPLMQPEEFAEFVVPSGVLSKDEIIEVLIYFLGKGSTKFSTMKRNIIIAKDAYGFHTALTKAVSGDVIQLVEEMYTGYFYYKSNSKTGITIQGAGQGKTIIQQSSYLPAPVLKIDASNCTLKDVSICSTRVPKKIKTSPNLQVKGCLTTLTNVTISGGEVGIEIDGNSNNLDNLAIENSAVWCLKIDGNFNTVSNTSFNLAPGGCKLTGNGNSLLNLNLNDVLFGILVSGKDNCISSITYNTTMNEEQTIIKLKEVLNARDSSIHSLLTCPVGVKIINGKCNTVSGLITTGIKSGLEWGVIFRKKTDNCTLEEYKGDGVDGGGWDVSVNGKFHSVKEVNVVELVEVEGSSHKLENCRAKKLVKVGGQQCIKEVKNCNFSKVTIGQVVETESSSSSSSSSSDSE